MQIYNSRNLAEPLNQQVVKSKVKIYNSRNLAEPLNLYYIIRLSRIYNSRNLAEPLNMYIDKAGAKSTTVEIWLSL